ncbi:hypothetical protein [uncultured Sulfitobacter sp.]|uniref:hypothetical protein n=1 Tax=uncultured Sulfitobacter sp. TaxID=191468 RepID=UPI002636CD23|nr:hypothetical protein [uncultured Sulfitobacter sp.]
MNRFWQLLPLEWRLLAHEYGALILSGGVFIAAAVTYFILATPDRHSHVGYFAVEVISTFDSSSDTQLSFRAVVRLPDGTTTTVSTNSLAAAQWFVSDTCVEQRQRENGRTFYRLAAPSNCRS